MCQVSNSGNGPLMLECPSLLWALAAIVCVTCPTVATVRDVRVPVAYVGASSNHSCATCPTIATGEARPLLLGQ
jgi:hypothetical protein